MALSIPVLALGAVLTLALFLCILDFSFWHVQRDDQTPLWLAAWLAATAVFALCRLLQFAPLGEPLHFTIPRLLLTAGYSLGWFGYEVANAFVGCRPPRWERVLVICLVAAPMLLLWTSNLILTSQAITRTIAFGGEFHGVVAGPLYLPASFLILGVGAVPPLRLIAARDSHRRERLLLAMGYLFVILFSLNDFIATSRNLVWLRLSDYGYLPMAIFFNYIQVQRFGWLYRDMNAAVQGRTAELSRANETLRAEVTRRQRVEVELKAAMSRLTALLEHMQTGILFEDESRRVAIVNQAFCELFRIPARASALAGADYKEIALFSKALLYDPEGSSQRVESVVSEQRVAMADELLLADGRTFERDYIPVVMDDRLLGHLWQYRDITERKQAEEALRASEYKFATAFRTSPDSININRLADGLFLEINEGFTSLTGYTAEDVRGKTSLDIAIWADPADRARLVRRLRERGEASNLEASFRTKDGQIRPGLMSARIIEIGGEASILSVTRDISELKQAEEELRRKAAEMTALYETTRDLVKEQDLSRLLHTIVERATDLLGASSGGLYLCEPEKRQVRCTVSYNTPRDYTGVVLKYGEGAAGRVAETGEPLIIENYRTWEGQAPVFEQDQPFVSVLSVPMRWQEEVLGIIHVIENSRPRAFNQEELRLLTLFANQAALAVENARLFEFEQRRRLEAGAIAEVGRDISASLQLHIVLERIASHAKDLLRAETSAVYLSNPEKPILNAIAALGPDAEEIKQDPLTIGEGILGTIAARKEGEIVNYDVTDARAIQIKGTEVIPFEHIMGVPLISRDRLTGLIAVWRVGEGQEFKSSELDFLRNLAGQATIAIDNASLFEAERTRRGEAETLRTAAQIITSTLDQKQAIEMILDQLSQVVPYESASVQLLHEGYLEVIGGRGWADPSAVLGIRFPIPGDNPNTIVLQERRPLILTNALEDYAPFGEPPHGHIRSWLGVPLIAGDRVIGMFAVDHSQAGFFTEATAQMVNVFAAQAAIAIENARLFEDTRRKLAELEILQTIASALRIAQAPDEVFPIILTQLINLLDFHSALVDMIDESTGEIVSTFAHGSWVPFAGLRTPANMGGSGRVIATGQPYVTADVIGDGVVARPDLLAGINAAACIPIMAQRHPIGTLWVGRQGRTPIPAEEVNLLVALGEMMGNAIQRMKLHEQTVHQAEEIRLAYDLTLEGWAKALELRDKETEGHSRRVTHLTLQLARRFGIPAAKLAHIRRGVLLHDIGKMGMPDRILRKRGPLSADEWGVMRKHPTYAYELLEPIDYLRPALDIPYCHHEKWDGTGYPRGLKGEQIPLEARIFAVADVWDALTSDRSYRLSLGQVEARAYLLAQSGTHFDPQVVAAFFELLQAGELPEGALRTDSGSGS